MKALTIVQKEQYLKSGGQLCPCCESSNIELHDHGYNGDEYSEYVYCWNCKIYYTATYKLVNVELDKE